MQIIEVVKPGVMHLYAITKTVEEGRCCFSSLRLRTYKKLEAPHSVPTNFSLTSESCLNGEDGDLCFDEFFPWRSSEEQGFAAWRAGASRSPGTSCVTVAVPA